LRSINNVGLNQGVQVGLMFFIYALL